MVCEPRNNWRNHDTSWNSGSAKLPDRIQAGSGGRRARLEHALQFRVERRHGNVYRNCIATCEVAQEIDISRHQTVLRNDRHRITKFGQHFETTARYTQLLLNRLIRIGYVAVHERLRFPNRLCQFNAHELWSIPI